MLKWKSSCQPVLYLLGSAMGCKAKGWAAEAEWVRAVQELLAFHCGVNVTDLRSDRKDQRFA